MMRPKSAERIDSQLAPRKVNIRKGNGKEGEEKSFPGFPPIQCNAMGSILYSGLGGTDLGH